MSKKPVQTVIIILGNRPLDETTPAVDTIYRVIKGVELFKENPNAVMIMTGGKTAGRISEAEMMGLIAWSRGVPAQAILLEDQAKTTQENALFSARLLKGTHIKKSYLVSKEEHLSWAMPFFHKFDLFRNMEPVDGGIRTEEIINQMENYLNIKNNPDVEQRLKNLKLGIRGVD